MNIYVCIYFYFYLQYYGNKVIDALYVTGRKQTISISDAVENCAIDGKLIDNCCS